MEAERHRERIARCTSLMRSSGLDVLLLTKPANMTYLTGDGRLCAYAMITREGVVAPGVPVTDVEDVSALAVFDHIVGFDDEVGQVLAHPVSPAHSPRCVMPGRLAMPAQPGFAEED